MFLYCQKDGTKMKYSRFAHQYYCPLCNTQTSMPKDYIDEKRKEELREKNSLFK